MSIRKSLPIYIREPDPESSYVEDRFHLAILRGKTATVQKLLDSGISVELNNRSGQTPLFCACYKGHLDIVKILLRLGADPNRRCSILCCTPVHAACWSGNNQLLTALLLAGGDLRLHDQKNRSPRDWAMLQPNADSRLATLSLIESFRQMAMKSDTNLDSGVADMNSTSTPRLHRASLRFPTKLRNTLASIGLVCNENCDFVGPLGNVQGTGFGKIIYGHGDCAAALWPVPLVNEKEILDPDDDGCGAETDLNGLLPRGIGYRTGSTTEIVFRRWNQTPVSVRRMRDNQPPDLLFEELHSMSRLRHPGLILLLGVSATQHWESVQLIYEPIYQGSLYHRLHIMGTTIPLLKRLLILQQVCDALIFLHSKGLLHCSVSSHAVHLVSSSQAKLGCLETLVEDDNASKRVYRKVPSSHWEWMMPWLSPECSRGENPSTLSDVYSFCCLVWEACTGKLPWSHLDLTDISHMWQRHTCSSPRMLPLDPAIPLHITSFIKLGLQPELSGRGQMDFQEIYLMLRLQAAFINSQPKETNPSSPPLSNRKKGTNNPQVKNPPQPLPSLHEWDAVKQRLKRRIIPPPPPPPLPAALNVPEAIIEILSDDEEDDVEEDQEDEQEVDQKLPIRNFQSEPEEDGRELEQETTSRETFSTPSSNGGDFNRFGYGPTPHLRENKTVSNVEFAIKPASHTTERHTSTCLMSHQDRSMSTYLTPCQREDPHKHFNNVYSAFNEEMRTAVAQPSKLHNGVGDFENWRQKIDEVNEESSEETTVEVTGNPSSTSTPRHSKGVTFLACSSAMEDPESPNEHNIGGVKPKRSLKFNLAGNAQSSNRVPSFFSIAKPRKEFVASLTAIFNDKIASSKAQSILKKTSASSPDELQMDPTIGDTFVEGMDCVSRGVQCNSSD